MGKASRQSSESRHKRKSKKERDSSRKRDQSKTKDGRKKIQDSSASESRSSQASSSVASSSAASRSGLSSSGKSRSSHRDKKKKSERRSSREKKKKEGKKDKKGHKDRDRSQTRKKSEKDVKKKEKKRSKSRSRRPRSRERDTRERSRDRREKDRSKTRRSREKPQNWRNKRSGSRRSSRGRGHSRDRRSRERRRPDNNYVSSRRNDKPNGNDKGKSSSAFKFDSPPREMKIIEEKTKDMFSNIELLSEMIGNLTDFSQAEICQQLQILQEVQAVQSANIDRKLYIGNIAKNITTTELTEMLNRALEKLGTSQEGSEQMIVNSWIAPNCQYAICEFRSSSDADAGMSLNNILLFGKPLRVGRFRISPGAYSGKGSGNLMSLLGITGVGADHTLLNKPFKIYLPSKVLVLLYIVSRDQLVVQEEYEEIYEDIKETMSKYGKVVKLVIPQPKDGEQQCPGMGHAFVEYTAISSAQLARREVCKKLYNSRKIEACYYDETKFAKENYDLRFTYIK